MFIKNIVISGFRSYREQSFPDGLSEGVNTVVGKNGSGKSNFFAAIQFVLNEKYANLRVADRKELFHVGSGRQALSIFVEIVFDNSDGRLVLPGRAEENEVRIRRTVGLKQDEYRVNDRKFSATEVHQLLESAGFSASNPYYVVEQGKISHLANMSEEDRYQLIKEVAGTKVYESRKQESKNILSDTQAKMEVVNSSIAELDERLKELEAETTELRQFDERDKEKKCIEYCIFTAELNSARDGLQKLETEWKKLTASSDTQGTTAVSVDADIARSTDVIRELVAQVAALEGIKKKLQDDITAINNKQAVAELDAAEAHQLNERRNKEVLSLRKESAQLRETLSTSQAKFDAKNKEYIALNDRARTKQDESEAKQRRLQAMQEKRNRTKLFKSKKDRDAWIEGEVRRNNDLLAKTTADLEANQRELTDVNKRIKEEQKNTKLNSSAASRDPAAGNSAEELDRKLSIIISRRDKLNQERRMLWQKVHEQENVVQRCTNDFQRAKQQLERSVKFDVRQGLLSLQELLSEVNDEVLSRAVHGPLIDLIQVADGFETAVEVTAGNTLFNIVVDSFDTSAKLLDMMNKRRKPGRISFFPLDTCNATPRDLPSTRESSPLLSKIQYDPKFAGVVAEVFGKTMVTTTLESGAKVSKEQHCDVVTLDGDQFGRRGGITGGFIDRRNAKLAAYRQERYASQKSAAERATLDTLCQDVATVEQRITEVLNEIEALQNQNSSAERAAESQLREARLQEERVARLHSEKENLLSTKRSLEQTAAVVKENLKRLSEEKAEEFKATWTDAEEQLLVSLSEEVSAAQSQAVALHTQALQAGTEVQLLEDTNKLLERRIAIVEERIRELGATSRAGPNAGKELDAIRSEHQELVARLESLNSKIEATSKELHAAESQLELLKANRLREVMGSEERKGMVDKIQMQRNLLIQRRDDAQEKLRRLGIVPAGASELLSLSMGRLMHQLKQVNEHLKKFSHVNRKALDQHTSLQETRNDLNSQRDALKKELDSILELMEHLEKKKDEAIERTYKQIQFQFEAVFRELSGVADSVAELQLVTSGPGGSGVAVDTSSEQTPEDPYFGARIRVSFGLGAPVSNLEQLSGGQKSLVALALIFAIQRCDPAPFYLFDEIDAALDTEYRNAVAKLIAKQAKECQFIVASFKTEMVEVANRVLGIFFHNKVSRIQTITKEEGFNLLRQVAVERKRPRTIMEVDDAEDDDGLSS